MVKTKELVKTKKQKADSKELKDGADQENTKTTSKASGKEPKQKVSNEKAQKLEGETAESTPKTLAKAGKRSAKSLKESEEKEAKEARKASSETNAEEKPKKLVKPARSRLERRGKKFRAVAKLIDKTKEYSLKEAVELAQKTSTVSFDATVELHIRLGVDPKQADQNIRGTVVLPAGTGKTVKVAVFGDADDVKKAKAAGADIAGADEFLQQLDKGDINFDVLIATPKVMVKLSKYARVLGPKGLMPNPKSGTVTADVAKAIKEAKAGKVEYRVDSAGIIHLGVAKVSFKTDDIVTNAETALAAVRSAKPSSVKGNYIRSIYLTTSMGPSVKLSIS